jgi:hypothetical protein
VEEPPIPCQPPYFELDAALPNIQLPYRSDLVLVFHQKHSITLKPDIRTRTDDHANVLFSSSYRGRKQTDATLQPEGIAHCLPLLRMVQTLQPVALGLIVLWPTLSTITVFLRFWSRSLMRKFYWGEQRGSLISGV